MTSPRKSIVMLVTIFSLLAFCCVRLHAQTEQKIGYVDIDRITERSLMVRDLVGDIEKRIGEKREEVDVRREAYSEARAEIQRKRSVLSESEAETLLRKARDLKNELDDEEFELNRMLRDAERQQMEPALQTILEMIRAIGREEGYTLILRGEVVLYGVESADISDKVVERLDQAYKQGEISLDNPSTGKADDQEEQRGGRKPAFAGEE